MHHTVHLFYKLDYHYYTALFKALQELSKENSSRFFRYTDGTYHCHLLLDEFGIKLILRSTEFEEGISYKALEIIMSPMRLLNTNDYLSLASKEHCSAIYSAFRRAFLPIKKKFESRKSNRIHKFRLHNLDVYSFKRVDFAVNFRTEHTKLYMKLIKRAHIPAGFQPFLVYSESGKRYVSPENSFYIFKKSKSKVTLNVQCYDKGEQLKVVIPQHGCDHVDVIRFEVQCHYNKVYRIIKTNKLNMQGYSQFFSEDISGDTLHYYFKKTIGYGSYYTLPMARKLITDNNRLKPETKKALIETLELVNDKRGIWKAKESVRDESEFMKRIKRLHDLGINPVTIPLSEGVGYLPCLFELS